MRIIEKDQATGSLAEYTSEIGGGAVVVTVGGRPVAALVPIENADMETVGLSMNPQFLDLIERSRARVQAEGGVSSEEIRRRLG